MSRYFAIDLYKLQNPGFLAVCEQGKVQIKDGWFPSHQEVFAVKKNMGIVNLVTN